MKKTLLIITLFFLSMTLQAQTVRVYVTGNIAYESSQADSVLFVQTPDDPIPPYGEVSKVDLGLPSGTRWATMNLGATQPEEYGHYFAWGEISPKENYSWSNYRYCNGTSDSQTKYCTHREDGQIDNKILLEAEDDAARMLWGDEWRMPTREEQDELRACNWTWTSLNGVNGYRIQGPNGNSIFLPAAGCMYGTTLNGVGEYGLYWGASLYAPYSGYSFHIYFESATCDWVGSERYTGQTIRPVANE